MAKKPTQVTGKEEIKPKPAPKPSHEKVLRTDEVREKADEADLMEQVALSLEPIAAEYLRRSGKSALPIAIMLSIASSLVWATRQKGQ